MSRTSLFFDCVTSTVACVGREKVGGTDWTFVVFLVRLRDQVTQVQVTLQRVTWTAADKGCSSWLLRGLPPGALFTLLAPIFDVMLLTIPVEVFSHSLQGLSYSQVAS